MSGRSVSPASRYRVMDEREHFREHSDDDCDIEKDEFDDSENEQISPNASKRSIFSPNKLQSPEKSINHEASPHGSPRLTQRNNLSINSPPQIEREELVEQEIITYKITKSGKRVKVSERDSRTSSYAREFRDEKTSTGPKVLSREEYNESGSKYFIKEAEERKSSFGLIGVLVIGSCFICLAAITFCWVNPSGIFSSHQVQSDSFQKEATFAVKWMNLQKSFMNQLRRFWTTVGSATRSIVSEPEPRDPAVILLVVPKNSLRSSRCFAREYAATVAGLFEQRKNDVINFNSLAYRDINPDEVKMKIDRELEKGFREGRKVAVIDHLESLAAEAAMMFYRFCDNDQAPFKRVTILLILHLAEDELSEENDRFVEEKLASLWEPIMGEDKFRPLMSRIANSIAYLRPESPEVLAKIGC